MCTIVHCRRRFYVDAMAVKRTPQGKWQARWRDRDGRQRAKTFTRKAAADAHLIAQLGDRIETEADVVATLHLRSALAATRLMHTSALTDAIDPTGFFVYCLWGSSDRRPVYVGRSTNVVARLGAHLGDQVKRGIVRRVTLTRCPDFESMCRLEEQLIGHYRPEFNIAGVA